MIKTCEGLLNLKIQGKDTDVAQARDVHHERSALSLARPPYKQNMSINQICNCFKVIPRLDLLRESGANFKTQRWLRGAIKNLRRVVAVGPRQSTPIASQLPNMFLAIRFGYLYEELVNRNISLISDRDHQVAGFKGGGCIQPFEQLVRVALNLSFCRLCSTCESLSSPASLLVLRSTTHSIRITVLRTHSQDDFGVVCLKLLHEVVTSLPPRIVRANCQLAAVKMSCSEAGAPTGYRSLSKVTRLLALTADEVVAERLDLVDREKRKLHSDMFLTGKSIESEIHTQPLCASFFSTFTILKRLCPSMQSDYSYPQVPPAQPTHSQSPGFT